MVVGTDCFLFWSQCGVSVIRLLVTCFVWLVQKDVHVHCGIPAGDSLGVVGSCRYVIGFNMLGGSFFGDKEGSIQTQRIEDDIYAIRRYRRIN